jgi:hypothetical protein
MYRISGANRPGGSAFADVSSPHKEMYSDPDLVRKSRNRILSIMKNQNQRLVCPQAGAGRAGKGVLQGLSNESVPNRKSTRTNAGSERSTPCSIKLAEVQWHQAA